MQESIDQDKGRLDLQISLCKNPDCYIRIEVYLYYKDLDECIDALGIVMDNCERISNLNLDDWRFTILRDE